MRDNPLATQCARRADQTMFHFEAAVRARDFTIFAPIDRTAGTNAVGLALQPTERLASREARVSTARMQAACVARLASDAGTHGCKTLGAAP